MKDARKITIYILFISLIITSGCINNQQRQINVLKDSEVFEPVYFETNILDTYREGRRYFSIIKFRDKCYTSETAYLLESYHIPETADLVTRPLSEISDHIYAKGEKAIVEGIYNKKDGFLAIQGIYNKTVVARNRIKFVYLESPITEVIKNNKTGNAFPESVYDLDFYSIKFIYNNTPYTIDVSESTIQKIPGSKPNIGDILKIEASLNLNWNTLSPGSVNYNGVIFSTDSRYKDNIHFERIETASSGLPASESIIACPK